MKISNVTNFDASRVDSFFQASSQGKALVVVSITLICLMALWLRKSFVREGVYPPLASRVQPTNPPQPKGIPEPDHTYVGAYPANQDFFQSSEFGTSISEKMKIYESLLLMTTQKGQEAAFSAKMNRCVVELKTQIGSIVRLFQQYPDIKTDEWDAFRTECDTILSPKLSAKDICAKLKGCLDKLEALNQALQREIIDRALQQVDIKTYPHYDFTNLQTQYFHYLGLWSAEDFTTLLSTEMPFLESVGLGKMEDVDVLELRTMMPWIERLRQLYCYLELTKDEAVLRPLIDKAIEECRAVLSSSSGLCHWLQNQNETELNRSVTKMRNLFGTLERSKNIPLDQFLAQLKEIENQDIIRQLILLKAYLHQPNLLGTWQLQGVTGLAQYAKSFGDKSWSPSLVYQMGS